MIELTVPDDVAEEMVERQTERIERMTNVLNSFRSNNLTDAKAYQKLEQERETVINDREYLEEQIAEAEEESEEHNEEGLEELFG
jgi:predicted  nucleic acid-binding Zn-ribbon protein